MPWVFHGHRFFFLLVIVNQVNVKALPATKRKIILQLPDMVTLP